MRRLVERAVTVTILTSVVASVPVTPVSAADPGDIPPSGLEEPVVRTPTMVDEPTNPEVDTREVDTPEVDTPEVHTPEVHTPEVHVIVAGDNLWKVAADHLAAERAATDGAGAWPGEADIGSYWARLIDANRSALRSGDPDLVFPGERIALPPTRR